MIEPVLIAIVIFGIIAVVGLFAVSIVAITHRSDPVGEAAIKQTGDIFDGILRIIQKMFDR